MKRKTKKGSGVYAYLEATGILQTGDAAAIEQAKKEYWTQIRKGYKRAKRQQCNSYTIFLTDTQLKVVAPIAKRQRYSITCFIKEAALSYCTGQTITNKKNIGVLREATMLHYNTIEALHEEKQLPLRITTILLQETITIEMGILKLLQE